MHERRATARVNKVFRVLLATEEQGDQWFIARNISDSGMFVEMAEPFPLRTKVIVRFPFSGADLSICAIARVQNHYYFNYTEDDEPRAISGVGLRFIRFIDQNEQRVPTTLLH